MRECWINVYVIAGRHMQGEKWPVKQGAARYCEGQGARPAYRLHVRLKPDRLDGLEDMARQMMTSPNQATANHGATRLRMIQAARAKGVR